MKISTKGRYALRMMLDLALNQGGDYVSLKKVSERQCISKKYLEQIVPLLCRSGLVEASRGYNGGYRLSKEPSKYTVAEILKLTEGSLAPVSCLEKGAAKCERSSFCSVLPVWQGLQDVIDDYLSSVTLQDIADSNTQLGADNYSI